MSGTAVLVFETTHHALWAEEVARQNSHAVEVIPAPAAARAGCDLALEVLPDSLDALCAALRERSITFRVYRPA